MLEEETGKRDQSCNTPAHVSEEDTRYPREMSDEDLVKCYELFDNSPLFERDNSGKHVIYKPIDWVKDPFAFEFNMDLNKLRSLDMFGKYVGCTGFVDFDIFHRNISAFLR